MNVCVQRISVLSRWELHRFFETDGYKEVVSCFFLGAPIGLVAGLVGDPKLVIGLIPLMPLAGIVTTLHSFTKERESGILPGLLGSPVTAGELVLGKTLGYFLIGLITYWAIVLGLLVGLETGLGASESPSAGGLEMSEVIVLAVALMSALLTVVTVTVAVCWHAKTLRNAMFWSMMGAAIATVAAMLLILAFRFLGIAGIALCASTLTVLTAGLAFCHAMRLTPEPVLFRWVTRRSRPRRSRKACLTDTRGHGGRDD